MRHLEVWLGHRRRPLHGFLQNLPAAGRKILHDALQLERRHRWVRFTQTDPLTKITSRERCCVYLSRFVRVRDGDSVRRVRDVVERLVLVDVLQDQNTNGTNDGNVLIEDDWKWRSNWKWTPSGTDRAERERQRLQDVQHGPQHATAPQQVREAKKKNISCHCLMWSWKLKQAENTGNSRFGQTGQIFVRHSADSLVDVVEVDQEKLSVALQLLLVGFSFLLKMLRNNKKKKVKAILLFSSLQIYWLVI